MKKFLVIGGAVALIAVAAIVFVVLPSGGKRSSSKHLNDLQATAAPATPTDQVAAPGNGTATLRWSQPTGAGSPTSYVITPIVSSGPSSRAQTFNTNATAATVTGLTNGTSYTFTITAVNSIGTSAPSAPTAAITVGQVPATAFTTVSASPVNSSITVSWDGYGADNATGFVVTPYLNGTTVQPTQTFGGNATTKSVTLTGLAAGSYTFKVAGNDKFGTGPQSAATSPVAIGGPGAPTNATAVALNGSATISWTPPAGNGNPAVTGYMITPIRVGVGAQTPQPANAAATSQTLTSLVNGQTYTFKIAATNSAGTGPQSVASGPVKIGVPLAPTSPTSTWGAPYSLKVSWTAPADNGSAITGYVVTTYANGTPAMAQIFNNNGTSETISYLISSSTESYTFKVAAINGNGTGPQSAETASLTPDGGPQ